MLFVILVSFKFIIRIDDIHFRIIHPEPELQMSHTL